MLYGLCDMTGAGGQVFDLSSAVFIVDKVEKRS